MDNQRQIQILNRSEPALSPLVSVILPAHNSAAFLSTTLDSVLTQDFRDLEVLVIDDGSTDESANIARAFGERVRVIEQRNQGIARARNRGLEAARGRYIAFIDHDDFWHPNKLSAQLAVLDSNPDVAVCYGEFAHWDGISSPHRHLKTIDPDDQVAELSGWIYHQLLLTNWVLFSTVLIRREVFQAIGGFDPDLPPGDDWDLAIRASRIARFIKLRAALALYRQHRGQTSRKVLERDIQSSLRESTILRYGLAGPDGVKVDAVKLRQRRVESHLSYARTHAVAGSPCVAIASCWEAFRRAPLMPRTWLGCGGVLKAITARAVTGLFS